MPLREGVSEENVNISAGNKIPVITGEKPNHIQMFTLGFTLGRTSRPI
jgi:hypothetical protein